MTAIDDHSTDLDVGAWMEAERQLIGATPPCPPGCLVPAGHDYESVTNESVDNMPDHPTFVRFHEFHRGGDVSVNQWESNRRGDVVLKPAHIFIGEAEGEHTLDTATRHAGALIEAVRVLQALNA